MNLTMEGKPSSSSWVVDMEKMLVDADMYAVEMARWKKTSVYRVPKWIMDMTVSEAYRPQVVSLGPFHHGEPALVPMEEHKRRAVLHLVKRSGRPLSEFVAAIEEVADELQNAYDGLDGEWRGENRGRFVEMMVTDGCFLLEMMRMLALKKVPDDHAPNDPVFSYYGIRYLWAAFRSDVIVVENQVPLLALLRLGAVWRGTSLGAEEVNNWVLDFLNRPHVEGLETKLGLHPLHIFHKSFCGGLQPDCEGWREWEVRMPSAVVLSEAGIHFKRSGGSTAGVRDIDYEGGVLSMPLMEFHDGTEKVFLNLMAFEWLHPGAGSDVLSYVSFVEKMVDSERDVALLRSSGVLENKMRSDRKVVELLDTLSKLAMMNVTSRLHDVKRQVNAHCGKPRNKWRASFVHNYLRNPWVFMSLVAAVLLLVATLLQTGYTVAPFYTKAYKASSPS